MNDEHDPLISRLRKGLDRLTGDIGSEPPALADVPATAISGGGGRRRWMLGAAAATVVAIAAGGILIVTRDSDDQREVAPLDSATAVADDPTDDAGPSKPTGEQLYRAVATVLQDRSNGPQLCLGGVMDSYPPQCGGLDIMNWEWTGDLKFERSSGTRWGEYVVVGTYDREAQTFTLAQPARNAKRSDYGQGQDVDFSTPCEEPAGGWPEATEQELSAAAQRIQTVPTPPRSDTAPPRRGSTIEGFGGLWLGRQPFVLNVRIVGDLTAADATIREFYDGPLCLIPSERTLAELQDIQNAVELGPVLSASYVDVEAGVTVFETIAPDAGLERQLADRYGDAIRVDVTGLIPVAPGEDPDPGPGPTLRDAPTAPPDTLVPPTGPPTTGPGTAFPIDPDTPVLNDVLPSVVSTG